MVEGKLVVRAHEDRRFGRRRPDGIEARLDAIGERPIPGALPRRPANRPRSIRSAPWERSRWEVSSPDDRIARFVQASALPSFHRPPSGRLYSRPRSFP
jgi:hypothetical protein